MVHCNFGGAKFVTPGVVMIKVLWKKAIVAGKRGILDNVVFSEAVMDKMAKARDIFGQAVVCRESPATHAVARFLARAAVGG